MKHRRLAELADEWWLAIEPMLPAGADRTFARKRIEEIRDSARKRVSPRQLQKQCEERAASCDRTIRLLRKKSDNDQAMDLVEQLAQFSAAEKAEAKTYSRVGRVKRPHFLQQCELLWLWQSLGGDLSITTPKKGEPYGPVILFFQAASQAVFGKAPKAFQIRNIVQRDFQRLNQHRLAGAGGLAAAATMIMAGAAHFAGTGGLGADAEVVKAKT